MPINIVLDDDAIDILAAKVALHMQGLTDPSQSVTPSRSDTHRTQSDPVSGGNDSGWSSEPRERADAAPARERRSDSGPRQSDSGQRRGPDVSHPAREPYCDHGVMRFVKGGYSEAKGKSYPAFWGCSGPRNLSRDEKCNTINAQEWFDRVASE